MNFDFVAANKERFDCVALFQTVEYRMEQFGVDTIGRGTLTACWRILLPGGEKLLKAGSSNFSHQGRPLDARASGVVTTQSELVADLGPQPAQAIQEATPCSAMPTAE